MKRIKDLYKFSFILIIMLISCFISSSISIYFCNKKQNATTILPTVIITPEDYVDNLKYILERYADMGYSYCLGEVSRDDMHKYLKVQINEIVGEKDE